MYVCMYVCMYACAGVVNVVKRMMHILLYNSNAVRENVSLHINLH